MARRALPVALVLAAALFESLARPGFAFYALLAAVPLAAVAALTALGELVDARGRPLDEAFAAFRSLLWALALALVVAGTSARASVLDGIPASDLAQPALIACLGVLAVEALVAVVAHARQPLPVAETRGSAV